jgi:hypothetical protein
VAIRDGIARLQRDTYTHDSILTLCGVIFISKRIRITCTLPLVAANGRGSGPPRGQESALFTKVKDLSLVSKVDSESSFSSLKGHVQYGSGYHLL